MSFLFGRKLETPVKKKEDDVGLNLRGIDIGSYQPNNPFKDLLLLPRFTNSVTKILVLDNESTNRLVIGDHSGYLSVWDSEYGCLLADLKLHTSSITGIFRLLGDSSKRNLIVVSSVDKMLSVWNTDTYELVKTTKFSSNACKLFLNFSDLILVAGLDLKLYDNNLDLIDEYFRKTNENTIKHIIDIDRDRFVVASNFDLESYCMSVASKTSEILEKRIKLKEVNRQKNAHRDSIQSLCRISDTSFASGSSEGLLIVWNAHDFRKLIILKPSCDLQLETKLNLTSASCVKPLSDRYMLICSADNLSVYDITNKQFAFIVASAHNSKITDLLLLESHIITSAEDGSIRVWVFKESFLINRYDEDFRSSVKLDLVGECLGHSTSITMLSSATNNEIISTDFDNMVIIWRNSTITDRSRTIQLNKILARV